MEENDLEELLSDMRTEIRDDFFSKNLFVYLISNNIFFNIKKDKIYSPGYQPLRIATLISNFRKKEFFKDDSIYDYMRYRVSSYAKATQEVDFLVEGFIIMKNNNENLEYIKSISRDNKLKKLLE